MKVLAVVRDPGLRKDVARVVRAAGYAVCEAAGGLEARKVIAEEGVDAVLLGVHRAEDLTLLRALRNESPELSIVALGSQPGVDFVVEAFRCGARDFVRMPFSSRDLERVLMQLDRRRRAPRLLPFLARSPRARELLRQVEGAARTDATLLLVGESGTGKDRLARRAHALSSRRQAPLVVVACSGLPHAGDLFGQIRASGFVPGQLDVARGGTLLLDEVADLSLELQPKLLQVLQERAVQPLGGRRTRPVDFRLIATTCRDLAGEVAAGRFREDLYYRLDVVTLHVPPLRERPEDIPLLARSFLDHFAASAGLAPPRLLPDALDLLIHWPFHGNVRELESWMKRLSILHPGEVLPADRLGLPGSSAAPRNGGRTAAKDAEETISRDLLSVNLRELERAAVIRSLDAAKGNRTAASKALGISVRTLRNKIRLYELV